MSLVEISRALARQVNRLTFSAPVTHVYNPLQYARAPHEQYLERWGAAPKEFILLGMNPGPFGMVQTGVPFGDVTLVREWLGIQGPVSRPALEHPQRPVAGFDCKRSEVSGSRLWGWARDRFGTPERFFSRFFVVNYCPLAFMAEGGRNITPDKLPVAERKPLLAACDKALLEVVRELRPAWVIGIGGFAEKQAQRALEGVDVHIGCVLHPSPASPLANRGWAAEADKQLRELGIRIP